MIRRLLLAAAVALGAPAAAQPVRTPPAAAADWVHHVERTPEGGFRMGNPDAPLKLVEYGSVTCPHCAEFAEAADRPLRTKFIRAGRVSFEYRPFAIFPSDPGLFALLDCQGPDKYFDTLGQLYASQDGWRARIDAHQAEQRGLVGPALSQAVVRWAGVAPLFALSPQRVQACLADTVYLARLRTQGIAGERLGIGGTPTFLLNGRLIGPAGWEDLEHMLSAG